MPKRAVVETEEPRSELERLAEQIGRTGRSRVIRVGGKPVARLVPYAKVAANGASHDSADGGEKKPVRRRRPIGKPFTMESSLWDIVGIFSSTDGVTDVSTNKHKYLAEAFADLHE